MSRRAGAPSQLPDVGSRWAARPGAVPRSVVKEIRECEAALGGSGRILVRFSGTEPLARVMVEGPDLDRVEHFAHSIAGAIREELGD